MKYYYFKKYIKNSDNINVGENLIAAIIIPDKVEPEVIKVVADKPLYEKPIEVVQKTIEKPKVVEPVYVPQKSWLENFKEKNRLLSTYLCPADKRIQDFINSQRIRQQD